MHRRFQRGRITPSFIFGIIMAMIIAGQVVRIYFQIRGANQNENTSNLSIVSSSSSTPSPTSSVTSTLMPSPTTEDKKFIVTPDWCVANAEIGNNFAFIPCRKKYEDCTISLFNPKDNPEYYEIYVNEFVTEVLNKFQAKHKVQVTSFRKDFCENGDLKQIEIVFFKLAVHPQKSRPQGGKVK